MTNYKIKVNIELVECDESESEIGKEEDGTFSITISESDASSIDICERSLLQTAYPAIREKLAEHLSGLSKKKRLKTREPDKKRSKTKRRTKSTAKSEGSSSKPIVS